MHLLREITSLGRNARSAASLKVRQPLAKVEVILADSTHQAWLEQHVDLIAEELNVKAVQFAANADRYISYSVVPNFKRLGPRLGKNMPAVKKLLSNADGGALLEELKSTGKVQVNLPGDATFELDEEDIEVRLQAKDGWAAAQGQGVVVVLATELSPELISEGLAREVVRAIQEARKEKNCEFTDRIHIGIVTESAEIRSAVEGSLAYIEKETLATQTLFEPLAQGTSRKVSVAKHEMTIFVKVVT
jgi:isoleucyl-tRNA synthetase